MNFRELGNWFWELGRAGFPLRAYRRTGDSSGSGEGICRVSRSTGGSDMLESWQQSYECAQPFANYGFA